jgi:PAS domain S-box-containing protein
MADDEQPRAGDDMTVNRDAGAMREAALADARLEGLLVGAALFEREVAGRLAVASAIVEEVATDPSRAPEIRAIAGGMRTAVHEAAAALEWLGAVTGGQSATSRQSLGALANPDQIARAAWLAAAAEAGVEVARAPARALYAEAPDPIMIGLPNGQLMSANPPMERLLGRAPGELVGRPWVELIAREPEWVAAEFDRLRRRGHWHGRLELRRADGSAVPVEGRAVAVPVGGDTVYVAFVRELSGLSSSSDEGRYRQIVTDLTQLVATEAEQRRLEAAMVRADERELIAMDLHDGVMAVLTGVNYQLAAAAQGAEAGQADVGALLQGAVAEVDRALADLRRFVTEVRAPSPRLRSGLTTLARQLRAVGPARVRLVLPALRAAERRLTLEARSHVLQITREASWNALRHARASTIEIRAELRPDTLELAVRDDGRGFDPAFPRAGDGHGLANMVDRAARIGAKLGIESRPGGGTELRLVVPLAASG